MPSPAFAPGFRFSRIDGIVLVATVIAVPVLASQTGLWGLVVAFVVGHFFLFCNIVRMARPLELTWAAVFLALAGPTVAYDVPGWAITAGVSLLTTIVLVLIEMRKPSYHGAGWRWVNPGLQKWWEMHVSAG